MFAALKKAKTQLVWLFRVAQEDFGRETKIPLAYCSGCDKEYDNEKGHSFCAVCGTELKPATVETILVSCPEGHDANPGSTYCATCGTKLKVKRSQTPKVRVVSMRDYYNGTFS